MRPRRGQPLAEALPQPRPGGCLVKTVLAAASDALRALRREAHAQPGPKMAAHGGIRCRLGVGGAGSDGLRALEERFGREIKVVADSALERERFQIDPL